MRSRATSFLKGCLILPTVLTSAGFICGCNDDSHTTGTLATPPPGAAEARQKSIEGMKNAMKAQQKPTR
jgi:hypothetical protein